MIVLYIKMIGLQQWKCLLSDGRKLLIKVRYGKVQIIDCSNAEILFQREFDDMELQISTKELMLMLSKLGFIFSSKEGSKEYYARYYLRWQ